MRESDLPNISDDIRNVISYPIPRDAKPRKMFHCNRCGFRYDARDIVRARKNPHNFHGTMNYCFSCFSRIDFKKKIYPVMGDVCL